MNCSGFASTQTERPTPRPGWRCTGTGTTSCPRRPGHPPQALGGEVKVLDPDGNTVLLGQRERSASQPPAADDEASPRFSLLKEAAALVEARGGTTAMCQISDIHGEPCGKRAEVKLADAAGDTAWACLAHADEILVTVPGSFIASRDGRGIAWFLSRRAAGPTAVKPA